jgi:hypothetical protein
MEEKGTATVESRPMPLLTPLTRPFWEGGAEGKLRIQQCRPCKTYIHPPRPGCYRCQSGDVGPADVSGRGVLYSYTLATQAFIPYFEDKLPYILGIIALQEQPGLHLVSNVVDCAEQEVRIGMPLEVVFEQLPGGLALPLFRPART